MVEVEVEVEVEVDGMKVKVKEEVKGSEKELFGYCVFNPAMLRFFSLQADDKRTRQEGARINTSLLALKECIRALHIQAPRVPFRSGLIHFPC